MASGNAKFTVNNLFNVEGWVCVVTGGGTGIGLMIARAFVNNGAKVYITSRRRDVLEKAAKHWGSSLAHPQGKLIPAVCDITSKDSIRQLVDEVRKNETRVDVLVNNAGGLEEREAGKEDESVQALAEDLFNDDPAQWGDVYRTNVIGAFRISAAFLPLLHAVTMSCPSQTGSIINISSIGGITRSISDHIKYNVSKAATIHLTTMLAHKFRSKTIRVRVNNIAPGIFPTEMAADFSAQLDESQFDIERLIRQMQIPADRMGRDEEIVLACNQYAYGQTIAIDGGYLLAHG